MAEIAPLTPLRYDLSRVAGGLGAVIAPPYDVISPEERAALAARDPHNVVHLILPEGEGDSKYAHAAKLFAHWRAERVLVRDEEPGFYRLDQRFVPPGAAPGAPKLLRRGFLALVRLVPFAQRIVLPHERTLSGPKEDRLKLFRATGANLSPGFMLYRDPRGELAPALAEAEPIAETRTADGVEHAVAKIRNPEAIRAIVQGIAASTLLIADGHHRYETAVRHSEEVSAAHPSADARAEHRYFMTFLVNGDDPDLVVFPTHRHVHSLASFSFDALLRDVRTLFDVRELPRETTGADAPAILAALAEAGSRHPSLAVAARDGRAAVLTLRADGESLLERHPTLGQQPAVLRKTDVALLHTGILEPVLGITPAAQAAKTNIWYPQNAVAALAELRSGKGDVLFLMNATPVAQVRAVAEAGEVMPQKSTFFYPKVPTGLAVHTLDPSRSIRFG